MFVLGIDPGRNLGLALLELNAHVVIYRASTVHRCTAPDYDDVLAWTLDLLATTEFCYDVVAIEAGFAGPNPGTAIKLAELRGAIKAFCAQRKIDCTAFMPAEVKRAAGRRGNAKKHEVAQGLEDAGMILRLPSLRGRDENETDAIAIAYTYCVACLDGTRAESEAV